jgi:hypothetical protein
MATTTPHPLPYRVPRMRTPTGTHVDSDVERVRKLANVLDHNLVDPLMGFVLPGVGDLLGSLLGLYAVMIAIRRRMSPVIIARMLMNLAIDAAIGIVPLLGDLADIAFKANKRNVALLTARAETGGKATARDWLSVIGAAVAFGVVVFVAVYAVARVVRWIF